MKTAGPGVWYDLFRSGVETFLLQTTKMDGKLLGMLLVAVGVAAFGVLYRRLRTGALPDVPDGRFYEDFVSRAPIQVSMETLLRVRRRVAKVLGLPPEKLAVDQTYGFLSKRIGYLAELSVAWNDLADEAAEARSDAGLEPRSPATVGELMEDLLRQANGPMEARQE